MTMTDAKQTQERHEISEKFVIRDLETLKVVADPLRLRIVEAFGDRPRTVKQIAKGLGLPPNKLYYHINLLEEHGLIRVVETRIVSGIIEKVYLITAHSIDIERDLLTPAGERTDNDRMDMVIDSLFAVTRQKYEDSVRAGLIAQQEPHRKLMIGSWNPRLRPEQAQAFIERVSELLKESGVEENEAAAADAQHYALLVAFFPTPTLSDDDEPSDS